MHIKEDGMATKKQNRRYKVRGQRRILNGNPEFFTKVTGRQLHSRRYGDGLNRQDLRESTRDEGGEK
jgi:hypothetical protein